MTSESAILQDLVLPKVYFYQEKYKIDYFLKIYQWTHINIWGQEILNALPYLHPLFIGSYFHKKKLLTLKDIY